MLSSLVSLSACEKNLEYPSLDSLRSLVGVDQSNPKYKEFFKKYNFHSNTKEIISTSFASDIGVEISIANSVVIIGINPKSSITSSNFYSGDLPYGLKAGDTIAIVKSKLGKPSLTSGEVKTGYWMVFESLGMNVCAYNGELYQVSLYPKKIDKEVEQAGTGQPATRPEPKSEGSDKPQPEAEGRSR